MTEPITPGQALWEMENPKFDWDHIGPVNQAISERRASEAIAKVDAIRERQSADGTRSAEDQAWEAMVAALRVWGQQYMDQWDKFQFPTDFGPVYVRIARESLYPNSYDALSDGAAKG